MSCHVADVDFIVETSSLLKLVHTLAAVYDRVPQNILKSLTARGHTIAIYRITMKRSSVSLNLLFYSTVILSFFFLFEKLLTMLYTTIYVHSIS